MDNVTISKTKQGPLVSIIVITYNSGKYVLETLESTRIQTYQNLELIITDDGSKDNTIEICKNWLDQNKDRFVKSTLITVEKNTGIPANCNRGLKASSGDWIKFIAGDDALIENCIEVNINFIKNNQDIKALQTCSRYYLDHFEIINYIASSPVEKKFFSQSATEQYFNLKKRNEIIAPSIFLKREVLDLVGGFDEDFLLFEDITMWLNLTKSGIKVYFFEIETVNYRIHKGSVAKQGKPNMSVASCSESILFAKKYYSSSEKRTVPYLKKILKYNLIIRYEKLGLNNSSLFSKYLYMLTWKILT
ncbi:glycosyltransferase [Kaistella flava (ex Peng et al. 2021)]|uniref:Glycosyltransferase n=1 Tax=Kaistella flava (ex Peng et al. 2021) TaxID=2038776 RepID=A0A7M2Y9Y4_9FLAO|nr:glycosyltransferase [Kaistella flava (ex Peng et al. 2021)]QOW10629.1 glycosyltransferase [Kaistella flava (ex Peng et al. 2021)]